MSLCLQPEGRSACESTRQQPTAVSLCVGGGETLILEMTPQVPFCQLKIRGVWGFVNVQV